jgi:uncharacterized coiled-coil protein SlyX
MKALDQLEKQLDALLKEVESSRKAKGKLEERLSEMEKRLAKQDREITRLRSKADSITDDLDVRYRKKREEIQTRLATLLASLESL